MNKEKTRKLVLGVLLATFAFYCFVLLIRLFVDGRYYMSFAERFKRANLIPLATLYDYAIKLVNDRINVSTVFYNIFGNLIAFFPMGCYLPCIFQKMRKAKMFCVAVLTILVAVEVLQMILGVGFFDIDDIILNFAGAIAGWGVVHIPVINRLLNKIYVYR